MHTGTYTICIREPIHLDRGTYTYVYGNLYIHMYTGTYTFVYANIYTHEYANKYTYTREHIQFYTYVCMTKSGG